MFKPIISVVGHVDVGKTSFLDYFASSKTKEVNNITQEIRTIQYNSDEIKDKISNDYFTANFDLNGVIFIDTPGHGYFSSQREVTTKISHIAILIIDIVHGLNETHIELLKHFKLNKIDFIVILNKIDTIYGWKATKNSTLKLTFGNQDKNVMRLLNDYMNNIILKLAENEINAAPYYSNSDYKIFNSIIPLSAKTGEGMMDVNLLLSKLLNKKFSKLKLNQTYNNINGYIIDFSKGVFGKGYKYIHQNTTNKIQTGETINFANNKNATVKHILKNSVKVSEINEPGLYTLILDETNLDLDLDCGSMSIIDKSFQMDFANLITCNLLTMDLLEETIDENLEKETVVETHDLDKIGIGIITVSKSMEKPLISMFRQLKVPISLLSFNKLCKNDIIKVANNNKTKDKLLNIKYEKFRSIVYFDPSYSTDIKDNKDNSKIIPEDLLHFAKTNKIEIIHEKTIYKLKQQYENYLNQISTKIKNTYGHLANINLEILPQFIFTKTSPLVFGVKIKKGILKSGVTLVAEKDNKVVVLGIVKSIQHEKNNVTEGKQNQDVCIKVEHIDKKIVYKVDFDETYIVSTYMTDEDKKIYSMFKEDIESK